eukprot:7164710-Pyramimonas_sp.AAC.1
MFTPEDYRRLPVVALCELALNLKVVGQLTRPARAMPIMCRLIPKKAVAMDAAIGGPTCRADV